MRSASDFGRACPGIGPDKFSQGDEERVGKAQLGIGRRILAVAINIVVVVALLVILGLLFHKTHTGNGSASVDLTGISALIWAVLALAYLIVPKVRTGQTVGRWLVGGRPRK